MHAPAPRVRRPSRAPIPVAIGALLAVVLTGCSSTDADATTNQFEFTGVTAAGQLVPAAERAPAPAFTGELLDGTSFSSEDLAGDIVVINFWGSWCAPCRLETPDLQAVYADVGDRGVAFLGVDVKDQRQMASAFLADAGAQYPSLYDPRGEIALQFRGFPANVVPSTILLDAQGDVAAVYTGAILQEDLRAAVDALLAEDGS
ncbi:TlpA family protein disulfide reductase [Modestobacter muralis]|uniref:TlpA family protein disulfide reductase n=1 Tax=Modestobacter muralis TaxID=1608614 RepID=A0A6P0EQJ9_9ACTN|nr:TlpA disulfide reductase family protein [Modestobacter muralis]NEK93387.1 TlpA family protein disulfide reductase [Modestobacter muralis]NEN50154.1 TlpA family protein disulfide reductase [Modestobacter muralis]